MILKRSDWLINHLDRKKKLISLQSGQETYLSLGIFPFGFVHYERT